LSLFDELKRRSVFKVTVAYIIVAWLLLQVSDTLVPALHLPEWFHSGVAFVLILGFPVAIIFAWAFELTPEGLKRDKGLTAGSSAIQDTVSSEEKSIAVLPFGNRSADAEDAEFFAAGVHDELLTLLSKLGDLRVISRTSVERLDRNLSIPEIGTLLNVATVLEGQVQRAGDRLRINVQLISTTKEDHLWATTYDRELTAKNVFEVQSDIARMIADALQAQLSSGDEALLNAVPTENTEALNAYLLGRQLLNRGSYEAVAQAENYFREATELDPDYAEAWVAIADSSSRGFGIGMSSMQEYIDVAEPAVTRALELNDRLPEAHAQSASLKWRQGDVNAAEVSFEAALKLNPGDSRSLLTFGEYLRQTGRPREAILMLNRALEDDPLSTKVLFELGRSEMYNGHPEKNELYGQRILEIEPSSPLGLTSLVQCNTWRGKLDLAWPWILKALAIDPEDVEWWSHLGMWANMFGDPGLADRYLGRAIELGPNEPATLKVQAMLWSMRGRNEEALSTAREALDANLDDRWFSKRVFLRVVRDDALQTGHFSDALDRYRKHYPELLDNNPEFTIDNVNAAADLALLLRRSGNPQLADSLVELGLAWYRETQPPGVHGFLTCIVDVEFLALKAEKNAALDALQSAADAGWGFVWKWDTSNENLAILRDEEKFQAIVAQLEARMAAQLEAIRSLPFMGEFDLRSSKVTE
jgi:TolB-like protein/Tfp pilus assembly protein PilF